MRRLGVERDAAPAGAGTTYPRALGRPGSPSGPTTGVCRSLSAGRGQAAAGNRRVDGRIAPSHATSPEARSRRLKTPRWRAHRRRGSQRCGSRHPAPPLAPVGAPPPLMVRGDHVTKLGLMEPRERGGMSHGVLSEFRAGGGQPRPGAGFPAGFERPSGPVRPVSPRFLPKAAICFVRRCTR